MTETLHASLDTYRQHNPHVVTTMALLANTLVVFCRALEAMRPAQIPTWTSNGTVHGRILCGKASAA